MGRQKNTWIAAAVGAAAFAGVLGLYWLGGGNFERGIDLQGSVAIAIIAGIGALSFYRVLCK